LELKHQDREAELEKRLVLKGVDISKLDKMSASKKLAA